MRYERSVYLSDRVEQALDGTPLDLQAAVRLAALSLLQEVFPFARNPWLLDVEFSRERTERIETFYACWPEFALIWRVTTSRSRGVLRKDIEVARWFPLQPVSA